MRTKLSSGEQQLDALSEGKARLLELLLEERSRQAQGIKVHAREKRPNGSVAGASAAQQRLWFIAQMDGGSAYHIQMAVRLVGALNLEALQKSLNELAQRHEVLRTTFVAEEGDVRQFIAHTGSIAQCLTDVSHRSESLQGHLKSLIDEEVNAPFDLSTGPLIRVRLLRVSEQEHVLLITMHHIVSDGWSMDVFSRELAQLYDAFDKGASSPLPKLPIQYADYAQWQRQWLHTGILDQQLDYWRRHLNGAAPMLDLPADRPRPAVQSYRGKGFDFSLGRQLSNDLKLFAQRHEATLFMVVYAAWSLLLSRLSGQRDIVIGTAVANRQRPELEGLIGFFVNTLALRLIVNDDSNVPELLRQAKEVTIGAYDHQDVPFEQIVEALQPSRSLSCNPIFQVMLVVQNTRQSALHLPGLTVTPEELGDEPSKFDLLLSLQERGEDLVGTVSYAADLFDITTMRRWMDCFRVVLEAVVGDYRGKIAAMPMLPRGQHREVVEEFNDQLVPYARQVLIHELFEGQVERTPQAIAVVFGDAQLTYTDLNRRANQLARVLIARGVQPDERVAMYVRRGVNMIVAMLGILKAGGAYVPLDVRYPSERLEHMIRDSSPIAILTEGELGEGSGSSGVPVIDMDASWNEISLENDHNVSRRDIGLSERNLAYVIYTSGSTGTPKGVLVEHHSVVNLVNWHCDAFGVAEGSRCSCVASIGFDAASWEIWPSLAVGGTLVVASSELLGEPDRFLAWWATQALNVSFLPTPMAELAFSRNVRNPTLRTLLVGGDRLSHRPSDLPFSVVNNYGPTESTVVATSGVIAEGEDVLHIGKPIANTQTYILDAYLQAVPIGVVGELYIGGAGVARGYLNRTEQECQRFVADAFGRIPGARMYRTGDLVRWRPNGTIEFLGRQDHQVKIRGHRIELGEIEAQLALLPQVREGIVEARADALGSKRLVAYVTLHDESCVWAEELRAQLKKVLPEYMVPSAFVVMDQLPLTPHGKLDRRALPAPGVHAFAICQYRPPQGDTEEYLAEIWQELLRVERVGRDDNFFDLGGHSMLVTRVVFKVNQRFGSTLRVVDAYRNPTLQGMASCIRGGGTPGEEFVDLAVEAQLNEALSLPSAQYCKPARGVLLTGATGFVGRFLLAQLLQDTQATIRCLVRAGSEQEALLRLKRALSHWDLWREEYESRLAAIPGDLRQPYLGLDAESYEDVCRDVDVIYHCATSMNHLETYAMAKEANVNSAKELVRIAYLDKVKLINYVSSVSVFKADDSGAARVVREDSPIEDERHSIVDGYVASKWVAEKVFMTAVEQGLPCNIFRLGLVWPDSRRGRYDESQHDYRVLKSALLSGYGIENYKYDAAPIPVDYAARAIVALASLHSDGRGIFHVCSSSKMSEGLFERLNAVTGASLRMKSRYDWICEIARQYRSGRSLPIVPLIESAFSMDKESFEEQQSRSESAGVRVDCERTLAELAKVGIHIPELGDDVFRAMLQQMSTTDSQLCESMYAALRPAGRGSSEADSPTPFPPAHQAFVPASTEQP